MKRTIALLDKLKLSTILLGCHKRKLIVLPLLLLSLLSTGTQSAPIVRNPTAQQNDWILSSQKNGIDVFYKIEQCTDSKRILLRIKNSNSSDQVVDLQCRIKSALDIVIPSIKNTVPANSTIEGTCTDGPTQATFIILSDRIIYKGIVITIK
jgi:hypothetical protein